MNILKLGFIEAKSNWHHTPRWNIKLKSITQIEGCIIHRELQVVNEVCDYLYQNITEWPGLISHSFQWYQSFLCLLPFLFFSSPFIFIHPLHSTVTLGRLLQKEAFKRTCLRLPHKGHFYCHNRLSSTSWMAECSDKSLNLFWWVMKQTEHSKSLRCIIILVLYFSVREGLFMSYVL